MPGPSPRLRQQWRIARLDATIAGAHGSRALEAIRLVTLLEEPVVKPAARSVALLLLAVCSGSCGGSPSDPSRQGVQVNVNFTTDGAFSATIQGTTITVEGVHTFNLQPGTYQVSGQMNSPFLDVAFARLGTGGVAKDSITAQSGPAPQVSHCDASFLTLAPPQPFSVSFTVSTADATACQGP